MFGYENLKKEFRILIEKENLGHSYLFFGEPRLGKFLFAKNLANFLENQSFSTPEDSKVLSEALIILPIEDTIGIDQIRSLKDFLYKKPTFSKYRIAIIKDAEILTTESQSAMLKILEEPPVHGLIILISSSIENLFPAILSRVQKIYFPRFSQKEIEQYLIKDRNLSIKEASSIAQKSFGQIGKAIEILAKENKEIEKLVHQFLAKSNAYSQNHQLIKQIVEYNEKDFDQFFETLIIELRKDLKTEYYFLKNVLECLTTIKQINVNKKLQLEALWQTKK